MSDRFLICLAGTLREEEGTVQPVGGPYHRGRYAYSDHPRDNGGKTMMGILQREYDPWRQGQRLPVRPVRQITDAELTVIYRSQYWDAVRAAELPAGLDRAVFDDAVNCGVGGAAKRLQLALGVKADGHIGAVTLAAARAAEPLALIHKLIEARRAHHRNCDDFDVFGVDWLERCGRIQDACERDANPAPAWHTTTTLGLVAANDPCAIFKAAMEAARAPAPKAALPPPPTSMAQSTTGNAAVMIGGSAAGALLYAVSESVLAAVNGGAPLTLALVLKSTLACPLLLPLAAVKVSAAHIWLERRFKLITQGV